MNSLLVLVLLAIICYSHPSLLSCITLSTGQTKICEDFAEDEAVPRTPPREPCWYLPPPTLLEALICSCSQARALHTTKDLEIILL